jgi:hypothetical protein
MVVTVGRLNAWKRRHFDVSYFLLWISFVEQEANNERVLAAVRGRTDAGFASTVDSVLRSC